MRVLLQNLVGNALKFQDGTRTPEITMSGVRDGNVSRFEVKDNGIGIVAAFSDRVFTIFQRLHSKEDYPGTGIGLSTCRKFIRLCAAISSFAQNPARARLLSLQYPS